MASSTSCSAKHCVVVKTLASEHLNTCEHHTTLNNDKSKYDVHNLCRAVTFHVPNFPTTSANFHAEQPEGIPPQKGGRKNEATQFCLLLPSTTTLSLAFAMYHAVAMRR